MSVFKKIDDWHRGAREKQRVEDPLRIRVLMKELWPWYLPLWILPAPFVSLSFLGAMPREKLVVRGLLPFIICALVFMVPTRKVEMSRRETLFFFNLVPMCSFLGCVLVWVFIHDRYMR